MPRLISTILLFCFLFTTNALPVSAAISYTYDQNGNMTSDGTKCFEYNEANQMYRVKTCSNNQIIAEYIYDYSGKRLVKKEYQNGVLKQTVYSPTDEYETKKIEGGATQNTVYYKANDELAAKKNPDGSINYYHNDHLGSATILTDQSGAVVEKSSYEPYGEIKQGGTKSKFGYTGQEKDSETGLNYYDARYYDPHLQRFIQADDIIQNWYDPQSLNRYSYVKNNPIKYTDPSGNIVIVPILIAMGVSGAIGAGIAAAEVYLTNPNPSMLDYSTAMGTAFLLNAPLGGLGFVGGGIISSTIAKTALSPAKNIISYAVVGGSTALMQNTANNALSSQPLLNNATLTTSTGLVTGIIGGQIANKLVPASPGRPASSKISLSFSTSFSKKSAELIDQHSISESVSNTTTKLFTSFISSITNIFKTNNNKKRK